MNKPFLDLAPIFNLFGHVMYVSVSSIILAKKTSAGISASLSPRMLNKKMYTLLRDWGSIQIDLFCSCYYTSILKDRDFWKILASKSFFKNLFIFREYYFYVKN